MNLRNILSALATVAAIVILVVAGYYFRSQQSAAPAAEQTAGLPATETQTSQSSGAQTSVQPDQGTQSQQPAAASALSQISQSQILDYFADKDNNVFAAQTDGKIIKISGNRTDVISSGPIANVLSASFSYDGKRVMAVVGSAQGSRIEVFNVDDKTWRLYGNAVQSASWSPNSHRLAFLSPGSPSILYTLDTDSAAARPVEAARIFQQDLNLNWVSPAKIMMSDSPSAFWKSSVWSFDITAKTLSPVLADKLGLNALWSSSTSLMMGIAMVSNANNLGGQLYLVDQAGNQARSFSFLTIPSKCAFYDKPAAQAASAPAAATTTKSVSTAKAAPKPNLTVVCGIPRDSRALSINPLPDAYLKKAVFTSDNLFEIDEASGNMNNFFSDASKNIDVSDVKIFNQSAFFINRYDQKLYSAKLPK